MKHKLTIRMTALNLTLITLLGACAPKQVAVTQTPPPRPTVAVSTPPATLGQVADHLAAAADDYNKAGRDALLDDLEGGEDTQATRLQALVMVSRAFGPLHAPTGNNERLAAKDVDLSGVPEWAKADLENLLTGGALAPSDLGQTEGTSGGAAGGMAAEGAQAAESSAGDVDAAQPEGAQPSAGAAASAGDPLNGPASLKDVETYCERIFSLFGTNLKDDFYAAVNKTQLENTPIPAGQTSAGSSITASAETNEKVRALIREVVESDADYAPGSNEQKMRDFYRSVLAPRPGNIDPLRPWLERIDAVGSLAELREMQVALMEQFGLNANTLLPFRLDSDLSDPDKKVLLLNGALMYMSIEDYENLESEARKARRAGLIQDLMEVGEDEETAGALAEAFLALELEQFKNSGGTFSDLSSLNNLYTMDELDAMMPELGPKAMLTAVGFDPSIQIQSYDPKELEITASHMTEEELPLLKAQMKLSLLHNSQPMLTGQATEDEALDKVSSYLTTEVGQLYVQRHFPPEAKAGMQELVDRVIEAFKARIFALDWMAESTRQEALRKLDSLVVLIGYPDEWPENHADIKAPEDGGSYFENLAALEREKLRRTLERQNGDGDPFGMAAYMVNAAANRQSNRLVFPAGILQPPFYDPEASLEENLGGIGVTIAHEITHIFDDQGAQYDSAGAVRDWWTEEDYAHFQELCQKAADFYNGAEAAPGITISGADTLSENIADIGGMASALDVLAGTEDPDYDAFFRAYAKSWLLVSDRETTAMQAVGDEHAPKKLRVNEVLKHFQEFYDTYGIRPGDGMYVAPENRVKIW